MSGMSIRVPAGPAGGEISGISIRKSSFVAAPPGRGPATGGNAGLLMSGIRKSAVLISGLLISGIFKSGLFTAGVFVSGILMSGMFISGAFISSGLVPVRIVGDSEPFNGGTSGIGGKSRGTFEVTGGLIPSGVLIEGFSGS